jgi:catechol 2,3-dioxygenase-like lactoylglutathione lyase family enzyme
MIVIESINHISLTVSDLDKSVEFYKDMFDFEVIEKYSTENQVFMRMGDMLISLNRLEGFRSTESSKPIISFYIDEEDFEDAVDELNEMGIDIVSGPENIRNGKTIVFVDPDDNKIELCYPKL